MRRFLILAAIVVMAWSAAPSALGQQGKGKKPGNQSSASTLNWVMYTDQNNNGYPNWGDAITFQVSTTETSNPQVQLTCYQNGDVVYGAVWPITPVLTLSSRAWTGGAADCTATAYYFNGSKNTTIASLNFTVWQ